jgi:hypothetical protein
MAAYNKFNTFVEAMANGLILASTIGHTFSILLTNSAPTSTYKTSTDITEISTGNGYAHLGSTCQLTSSTLGSTTTVPTPVIVLGPAAGVVFTASGGSIGPFRYAVLLDQSTAYAASLPSGFGTATLPLLVSWYDYGSNVTLTTGETFTVSFDASSGIFQVA